MFLVNIRTTYYLALTKSINVFIILLHFSRVYLHSKLQKINKSLKYIIFSNGRHGVSNVYIH